MGGASTRSTVPGVLVVQHGPFTWGADVETAVENAVALEAIAALAVSNVCAPAGPGGARLPPCSERHFTRKHGPTRYYGQP